MLIGAWLGPFFAIVTVQNIFVEKSDHPVVQQNVLFNIHENKF